MHAHQHFMQRCLQLAALGNGFVAPNPMVGAVLVYNNLIIGEGFHQYFGGKHAEVNCIESVEEKYKHLIPGATLYVSLEPCNHFGKTPPCSQFIIQHQIKKVVIGCRDSFKKVNRQGIEFLQNNGVEVIENILEQECLNINKKFFTFHNKQRPFISLKFAQTANGFIGNTTNERLLISNNYVNRWVHELRGQHSAILVGINTVLKDNPQLNNRLWTGNNPVRILIDKQLKIPSTYNVFNTDAPTIIFNQVKNEVTQNITYVKVDGEENFIESIVNYCYQNSIQSILIEGGAVTLQHFIYNNFWDEAYIITNNHLQTTSGIKAPILKNAELQQQFTITNNSISIYHNGGY